MHNIQLSTHNKMLRIIYRLQCKAETSYQNYLRKFKLLLILKFVIFSLVLHLKSSAYKNEHCKNVFYIILNISNLQHDTRDQRSEMRPEAVCWHGQW